MCVRGNLFEQRHKRPIHEYHLVFGVIDHVGNLIGSQTDVEGMANGPCSRNTVV